MQCPTCQGDVVARLVYEDDETGNDLVQRTCENGHTWTSISPEQIIRMIGWGPLWRTRRDEWQALVEEHGA